MQWAVEREGELPDFVAARLRTALQLLFRDGEFERHAGAPDPRPRRPTRRGAA